MKKIRKIKIAGAVLFFLSGIFFSSNVSAYTISAVEIYRQAHFKNYKFMNWVSQYRRAMDIQNRFGDTAYCMALRYNDYDAQRLLQSYGANTAHSCVSRLRREVKQDSDYMDASKTAGRYPVREASEPYKTGIKPGNQAGNNYLWWGLGALAVGGGAVAIASSSGGGGSHHKSSSSDSNNGSGNNGGDNSGGNNGGDNGSGDNSGGNNGGGNGSGDNSGGNNGGDNGSGDNSGGNNGGGNGSGDNSGGNNGGDNGSGDNSGGNNGGGSNNGGGTGGNDGSDNLTTVSAASFKTDEYKKGNFLDGIHAAEAYSIIYKKDANGNLVSHQAASDNPLKKVKVGIVDTGVYGHDEIDDKITNSYDDNQYNAKGNVWGYAKGSKHFYVLYENDKYYLLIVNNAEASSLSVTPYEDLSYDQLKSRLVAYGITYDHLTDIFTLMNGSDGGTPGTSDTKFKPDYNQVATWWDIVSDLSHGTHIAGIVAADKDDKGMHGVAFENAEIYAGSWDFVKNIYPMVKDMVDNDVKVVNNSWGYSESNASNPNWLVTHDGKNILSSYAYAAKNGAVWVQATGNEGMHEAGVQAGIGKLDLSGYGYSGPKNSHEVPFLAVASLDTSKATTSAPAGRIADYSNWCGSAKGYCLAAPGSNVKSTAAIDDGYMDMSGTSMATPVVSGSIALLMGYYPYLSAQNIAWLLLETANKNGAYADSDIYGQGALDLENALNPVGNLSLASDSSFSSLRNASASKLALSGITQKKMLEVMPKKVTAFDELNRPFEYETASLVTTTHGSNAHLRQEVSRAATSGKKKVIKDEKTGFSFASSEALDRGGHENLSSMEVVHETDSGSTRFYYAENSQYADSDHVLAPTANPYFAMNNAYGAENTLKLSDSSKLKLSLQTGENGLYDRDTEQDRYSFDERSYAFGAEYSFNLTDYLELATVGGMLYEEDAMLGMNGEGGFGIKDGSTYYMGLKAALHLTPNLSLLAAYYRGYTQGQDTALLALSDMQTESYMIAGEYKLNAKDKIGLSLSSPISVVKGKATFNYASGRDNYSDMIYMNKLTSSLKPAAKEYDLGLYYQGVPKEDLSLLGKVETRFNADGEKGLTDYIGIVGVSKSF